MKKRIAWLLMSCLVVLSLILASCAQPAPTTPTTPPAPTGGETLGEILGRAEGIASMKYDLSDNRARGSNDDSARTDCNYSNRH